MGHQYEVHTNDGQVHHAETDYRHDDHSHATFSSHLLDVVKGTTAGVLGHVLVQRFIYRGKR